MTAKVKTFTKTEARAIKPGTWIAVRRDVAPHRGADGLKETQTTEVVLAIQGLGKYKDDVAVMIFVPGKSGSGYVHYERILRVIGPLIVVAHPDKMKALTTADATVTGSTMKTPTAVNKEAPSDKVAPEAGWPFVGKTLDNATPASAMKAGKVVKTTKMQAAMTAASQELNSALEKKLAKVVAKKPSAKTVRKITKAKVKLVRKIDQDLEKHNLVKAKKVATKRIKAFAA